MPSSTRAMHHGANDADSNYDDRSPTTTVRDALSRSTPSTTRATLRQPRGEDRHRRNARSNSTESRRRRGKNRRRRNVRSSSTESSRPIGQDRHHRLACSSSTESSRRRGQDRRRRHARSSSAEPSPPRGADRRGRHARGGRSRSGTGEGNRGRNHQRGKRTRDPHGSTPVAAAAHAADVNTPLGTTHESQGVGLVNTTNGTGLQGPRRAPTEVTEGEGRTAHGAVPVAEGANPTASGATNTPHNARGTLRIHSNGTDAYTDEDRLREERERTKLRDAMCTLQRATQNRGRVAGPSREDAGRDGALRGQHTPANRWGGPRIEAPPPITAPPRGDAGWDGALRGQHTPANLWGGPRTEAPPIMTAPPRGNAGRVGALRDQHTPANLWGGPRTEASPFMTAHEAGRYGRVRVKAPRTIDQLRQLITGGMRCPFFQDPRKENCPSATARSCYKKK